MSLDEAIQFVPVFVLAVFRLGGMMVAAPLFGGARIPQRIKIMFALVLASCIAPGLTKVQLPATAWDAAIALGSELIFGLAIGMTLNMVFVAVQWAGEIIGQQMGLGLGQVFDPQIGQTGAPVADLYFLLTLTIFLIVGGHRAFLRGVVGTFDTLPLLSASLNRGLFDLVGGLLQGATAMALQLAAPMLVTMILTDVVLGFLGKTVPQVNVMTAGLSLRAVLGMVVLIVGLSLTSDVIASGVVESLRQIGHAWSPSAVK